MANIFRVSHILQLISRAFGRVEIKCNKSYIPIIAQIISCM